MCFANVKKRAADGLYLHDVNGIRRDISLIFENALKYNLPKSKVHKEAEKLGRDCSDILDTVWGTLEVYGLRTKDEKIH